MARVRLAREADAARIADIYVETWRSTYAGTVPDRVLVNMSAERQTGFWMRAIQQGTEIVCIADDPDAGVVAVASAGPNRARTGTYAGEVYTLYVHPDHQNRGIGERLLMNVFVELQAQHLTSAIIWVLAANPSRFFYEAMGGKRVGEREEKMWGTKLREIAYGWPDLAAGLRIGRGAN